MEEASSYSRALFKRMLLYHWYRKGKSAREATELLCTDYGGGFVDERVVLDVYLCLDDRTNFKFDLYCMGKNLGHLDNDGIARHDEFGHHQEVPAPTYHQYNSQQHYYEPTSYQVQSTVNQLPSTVHQLPSTVNQLPSTVNQLPSTVNQLPSTVHQLPSTIHRLSSTVHQLPSTVNQLPSTVHQLPSTVNQLPSTVNQLPPTVNQLPSTVNQLPSTVNQLPSTVHPILSSTELSGSQSLTFNNSVPPIYESTNVYDASTSLNTNLNPPITSTSFQSSTFHSTPSTSTISSISNTTPRKSNTNIESYDRNNFPPTSQPVAQPPSQPLYTVERKLPPEYLYEDGSVVPRLARRHLILRCYKANYTVDQCERYLSSLNLPPICKVYKKNIQKCYKRFDREAATIADKTKTGRPPKVSDEAIEQYMVAHPRAPSLRVAHHFKLSNSTIYRRLNSLGYEPLHDRFVKKRADEPDNELSDEQLFEYKFAHPEAKAQDIGAHFNVRHMWINERLRRMGFVIPKYFKKCKPAKRRRTNLEAEQQEQEEGSSSSSDTDSDSDSDSNSRPTRVYPQRRPKTPGRPKGTKNIPHKGLLLHPVLGTPVTDIHEARQILRQAHTLTKEERAPRLSSEPKEGIHKKEAKRADYTKDSSVAISLTEILLNAPLNIPLPPPPPKSPPNKQTPKASYSARKRKPVKPPKVSAQPPRPIHLYKNPKFASNATQLTTTIKQEVDDDRPEIITIDVDLPDNLKSESCDDTILVDDELSFDPLSNLEL